MSEALVKYNVTDAAIAKMEAEYMPLVVVDVNDDAGFSQVHEARMVVKNHRVEVEKTRKELKADALAWGKKVDSEAKRITALLEPIETHLQTEEDKVTKEKERIKQAKIQAEIERVEKIKGKIEAFKNLLVIKISMSSQDFQDNLDRLRSIIVTDEEYGEFSDEATSVLTNMIRKLQHGLEVQSQLEAEQEAAKIEAERLEKQRKEQAEAQAKIDAESKRIADEKAKIEAEKKAEQDRKDREEFERQAKIKAEADAKAKMEAEALAKAQAEAKEKEAMEAKAKAEEAERLRIEALRPDKERFINYISQIRRVPLPVFTNAAFIAHLDMMHSSMAQVFKLYKKELEKL